MKSGRKGSAASVPASPAAVGVLAGKKKAAAAPAAVGAGAAKKKAKSASQPAASTNGEDGAAVGALGAKTKPRGDISETVERPKDDPDSGKSVVQAGKKEKPRNPRIFSRATNLLSAKARRNLQGMR